MTKPTPLLENAIKHNTFDTDNPLQISIQNQTNTLVIKNNKKARRNLESNNGVGLVNIEERYKLYQMNNFSVEDTADLFTVKLPLI